MNREEKNKAIDELVESLAKTPHFYLTDIGELTAEKTSQLRRICFAEGIELKVVKSSLLQKAFERSENKYAELLPALKGATSIMFTQTGNGPAKLIKKFRVKNPKPLLKAAYVEESVYLGDSQLDLLEKIKSKNELIADLVALLQSPAKNVISQLQSSGQKLSGVLKTLGERPE